ncbi:hypothetical protein RDV64_16630 [Acuticoccus sp. MNP-M23]|uniref:hypothetical protein n=1 Tax=Acuticoccus sp. MNP-M23 TaxID=3072793 RepID=UPI002814A345|nr:hypothetical protein [Acuticoccus sp. MNP-M23]WMS41687.1 hypothetical protein RDV64_16630 [Acuticoccus sp. MNP-M23]
MVDLGSEEAGRARLVTRLFNAFGKQLDDIEARVEAADGAKILDDTRVLSGLAKTLETLLGVERRLSEPGGGKAMDLDAVRTELAERLAALRMAPDDGSAESHGDVPDGAS